jgi:hypothetical protein
LLSLVRASDQILCDYKQTLLVYRVFRAHSVHELAAALLLPAIRPCMPIHGRRRPSHHFIISHTYSYSVLPTTCTMFCGARRRGHTQVACRRSTSDPLLPLVLCVLADADEQCTVQESMHARPGELKNGGFKLKLNNGIRLCAALDGGLGSHSFIRSFFLICSFIRS